MKKTIALAGVLALTCALPRDRAHADDPTTSTGTATLDDRERALHVLQRLAFGPRPGDLQRVQAMGWRAWVEQQLTPGALPDDALEARLRELEALGLTCKDLVDRYDQDKQRHVPARQLVTSVLLSALSSERQLQEVLLEFWRNHFNVSVEKGTVQLLGPAWERDVLRRHAFGRFGDLLMATAKHPAMLEYLDNTLSQKPISDQERKYLASASAAFHRQRGLNENYARELMELHTLGVDNGYTQDDVREVARALTGWTYSAGKDADYEFLFRHQVHDMDPKRVLGRALPTTPSSAPQTGVREGEAIIHALARARGTARFIAWKLCRYLVSDTPDEELVEDVARVFRETNGDLPAVYRAIVLDERFYARANYRAKFKTPFELLVSSLRAVGASVEDDAALQERLHALGQPIYRHLEPTGYADTAEAWQDPGVMSARWRLALDLGDGAVTGVTVDLPQRLQGLGALEDPARVVQAVVEALLPGGVGPTTRARLERAARAAPARDRARVLATLALGAPEFQLQ